MSFAIYVPPSAPFRLGLFAFGLRRLRFFFGASHKEITGP